MRFQTRFIAALLLLLINLPLSAVASVQVEIERAVLATPLRGAALGLSIRDADTRATISQINADQPLIPASNLKLLTTGAALHVLGSDFKFDTRLLHDGDRLIVIGSGDPAFGDPELLRLMNDHGGIDIEEFLNFWIQPVVDAGITHVSELIVCDRIFDREFVHSTWPADQLNRRYCAEIAGLNFHTNVLHFYPRPASDGGRPNVSHFEPRASWIEIGNSATSRTGTDDPNSVWIARQHNTNTLRFYGNVKHAYRVPVPVTFHNPPEFFARLLADRLRDAGINIDAVRLADPHEPPFTGQLIAPVISTPLATVVQRCNRDSQNLYAEAMLKRVGAQLTQQPGSWLNGAAMIRHAVHERLGSASLAASIIIADGSGLSRDNRIAPEALTAWLNTFHNDDQLGSIFLDSLAEPGREGTLRTRFRNVNLHGMRVQAKSGYISGVSCLAGYITAPDGRCRTFAIMINDIPDALTLRRARELQEKIVAIVAKDLAQSAVGVQMGSD